MRYIQICRTILNNQFQYPQCIIEIAQTISSYQEKRIELISYFIKNKHILKEYHKILSQVMRNGDKGIAAERVTFLELRKIYPNSVDEFICNKKELKTISFNIQWFGKCRLIPFLTVLTFDNIPLMKKYMSLVNRSRLTPDVENLDFLSYVELTSFEEICEFLQKKHTI